MVLALAFALGAPGLLDAQTARPGFEVFGSVGVGVGVGGGEFASQGFGDGRAAGPSAGGGIGMRPFLSTNDSFLSGLGFEFEVNAVRPLLAASHADTYMTGSILAHFGNDRIEAFGLLGAGKRFVPGRDDQILQLGAGAKVFLTRSVSVRPEIRLVPEFGPTTWRLSTGLGYRW
jgi:hypothetical protein